jgi:hypothetical protein
MGQVPGILCKSLGFGVFAEIFSKNIMIPSKERLHFLARLSNGFGQLLPNLVSLVFFL